MKSLLAASIAATVLLYGCASTASQRVALSHSVTGKTGQTIEQLKQACVAEAAKKLNDAQGKEQRCVVVQDEISTAGGTLVANCKIAVAN